MFCRAMTCFLIMITRYAAYLCFLNTILNSFYVGRYPLYIDKRMNRLLTIVIAVCSRCVFGHYFAINITIEHFLSIRELISFITIITFVFAPIVITLLIVCQNINGWFPSVNFNNTVLLKKSYITIKLISNYSQ
jgi:hypothetical protein